MQSRRGRPRKSTEQHKLEGTYRPARHDAHNEQLHEALLPKPEHLPESQRTVPKRWIRTAADQWCADHGYWFDERFVEHARQFGRRYLKLWEGRWAGLPFEWLDWQYEHVFGPIFGWYTLDAELGVPVRRHTTAYIEVPKKNGKSPTGAFVGVYCAFGDGEPGAQVFSAANAKDQASIVHTHAIRMVEASDVLSAQCKINRSNRVISHARTNSSYKVISGDANFQEGLNGNCCVCDEIHAWRGRTLWDALKYMGASRLSPLVFAITTAGDDDQSVCRELHDYGRQILDGSSLDPAHHIYICAADPKDDPADETTWAKANPSLGSIIRRSEMRQTYEAAKGKTSTLIAWKRYRLNVWATTSNPWLNWDQWEACGDETTLADARGWTASLGLDMAKNRDLAALVAIAKDADGLLHQFAWHFMPEAAVERYGTVIGDLYDWIQGGWMTVCEGPTIRQQDVEAQIKWCVEHFDVQTLIYDPQYAEGFTERLVEELGIEREKFPQNMTRFMGPTSEYEAAIAGGQLRHNANPVLDWQAAHVNVKRDHNDNIRPVKPREGDLRKIDGIVAGVMAYDYWLDGLDEEESVYNDVDRDLFFA
jgi:phage terminase large subunit-like protein